MNKKIQEARNMALKLLQPKKSQLEHGLELHRNSIVFDSYGFSPRAAIDGAALNKLVKAGATGIEIEDAAEEMQMTRYINNPKERKEYMLAWEASGVTCVFQNAGEEGQSIKKLIKRIARYTYATDMMKEYVVKAVTPDDIVLAKKQNKRCLYFTSNGVPLAENLTSVEEELRYITTFFQLGSRMMHLTYNRRNLIGDGCSEPANGGLSDFGKIVVKEMNRVGVIVDISHSGLQTSFEAAKISKKPVVASHSACLSLNRNCRCKSDEVIRAVCDSNGYTGICCIPQFLGLSGDINALLDHVDHIVKKFGADYAAIGTDLTYTSSRNQEEWDKVTKFIEPRAGWESFWQPDSPASAKLKNREEVKSLMWTNWPMFTVGLVQRGYSDKDIQKIIGGNVLRVAKEVLKK